MFRVGSEDGGACWSYYQSLPGRDWGARASRGVAVRVLVSSPAGLGHLGPVLALAAAARDAGHDVVCVLAEEGADLVGRHGLTLRTLPTPSSETGQRAAAMVGQVEQLMAQGRREEGDRLYVRESFGRFQCEVGLDAMADAVQDLHPDVVLTDPFQSAALAGSALTEVALALVPFAAWQPLSALLSEMVAGMLSVVEPLGLDHEQLMARLREAPRFSPLPASLEHGRDDNSTVRWRLAEPGQAGDLDQALQEAIIGDERPVVYATLGTIAGRIPPMRDRFLDALLPALAELDVRGVLTVGRDTNLDALPAVPDNVMVAPFLPQRPLLAVVDLAVSHGGLNTMLDVSAAGLPHLVIPLHAADGHWNAARIDALGVGRSLTGPSVTPSAVATTIGDLLGDPGATTAAARLAEEVAALPAPREVMHQLEEVAS